MNMNTNYNYNYRNQKSIHSLIDNQFSKHAKLLPVRIDLGYKTNQAYSDMIKDELTTMEYQALNYSTIPHEYLSNNDIHSNWEELLNKLKWNKRVILKDMVGYAWKVEYGIDKGIHYHLILLFNGNKVMNDYYYATQLGELWMEITNGCGVYFNCSVDKLSRYGDSNALKVTRRDEDRTNLYNATSYLTKIDENDKIARKFTQGRLFGRSAAC